MATVPRSMRLRTRFSSEAISTPRRSRRYFRPRPSRVPRPSPRRARSCRPRPPARRNRSRTRPSRNSAPRRLKLNRPRAKPRHPNSVTTRTRVSSMQDQPAFEQMAATLEASGDYKILRRLVPRSISTAPFNPADKVAVVLDVETTGLDHTKDEVIELGMLRFSYSEADVV